MRIVCDMQIGVITLDGAFDSAVTSVLDVLRVADALRPRVAPGLAPIRTRTAGFAARTRTARGLEVAVEHRLDRAGPGELELLVVPALDALDEHALDRSLQRADVRALRGFLMDAGGDGGLPVAAACTGTFVLAEARMLDGRQATTTWWLTGLFARRYPAVDLDMSRMVVTSGAVTTAGAAFAHIDLAVAIVSQLSPALADAVCAHLLVDERPARSTVAGLGHLAGTDRLVSDFEHWVRERLAEPFSVEIAADALCVTRRTLERHVRARVGMPPAAFVRSIRLEQARHLRRTTRFPYDTIAARVGYTSGTALRRALSRDAGTGGPSGRPRILDTASGSQTAPGESPHA